MNLAVQPQSRVLVVDDETAVLKLVRLLLTRARYEVETCGSAPEGLTALAEGAFDCVITDAVMPGMSGYDFVKMIRNHPEHGAVPILMLTRKRHRQDVKKAVEAGVTDYVLKPIDEHLLLDKVELCLKKSLGKRHVYEGTVYGKATEATISLDARILSISEADMTIRTPMELEDRHAFQLGTSLFEEIGIDMPMLRPTSWTRVSPETPDARELPYEMKFAFMGVPDADLRKIRSWLQKEEIRRRK
jgi:CheY-like chemotaxis protein